MSVVVVGGALANKSFNGGEAWVRLNWLLGFRQLGFDVYLMEQIDRAACVDNAGRVTPFEQSVNVAYFRQVIERFGLTGSAALICEDGAQIEGLTETDLFEVAQTADLLVNISGNLRWPALFRRFRRTAYLDIDPGFTQIWHASGTDGLRLEEHDLHYTIAENIGTLGCSVPTDGIRWRPTRQPVVLEQWPIGTPDAPDRFTTVTTWRGPFGKVAYDGKTFGLKLHEFRKFIALPEHVPQTCELALSIDPADHRDRHLLERHGWQIVDPRVAAGGPEAFRRYVQASGGEFSVAQGVYVETHSGWFSDRTTRYLASGKPVG